MTLSVNEESGGYLEGWPVKIGVKVVGSDGDRRATVSRA